MKNVLGVSTEPMTTAERYVVIRPILAQLVVPVLNGPSTVITTELTVSAVV